jgi:DNA-binding winged helix-turn-helix (wHTH) protein
VSEPGGSLEFKIFRVLVYLLQRPDRAVAKQELLQACWPGTSAETSTEYALRNCLHKIRRAVGDVGTPQAVIETIRGYGYRCVAAVTCLPVDTRGSVTGLPLHAAAHAPSAISPPTGWRPLTVLHDALAEPPVWLWQHPAGEHGCQSPFDVAATRGLSPFVGREPELAILRQRWAEVQEGRVMPSC